jgi:hypothetical protein
MLLAVPFSPPDEHIAAISMKAQPAFANILSGLPFNHPSQRN